MRSFTRRHNHALRTREEQPSPPPNNSPTPSSRASYRVETFLTHYYYSSCLSWFCVALTCDASRSARQSLRHSRMNMSAAYDRLPAQREICRLDVPEDDQRVNPQACFGHVIDSYGSDISYSNSLHCTVRTVEKRHWGD